MTHSLVLWLAAAAGLMLGSTLTVAPLTAFIPLGARSQVVAVDAATGCIATRLSDVVNAPSLVTTLNGEHLVDDS